MFLVLYQEIKDEKMVNSNVKYVGFGIVIFFGDFIFKGNYLNVKNELNMGVNVLNVDGFSVGVDWKWYVWNLVIIVYYDNKDKWNMNDYICNFVFSNEFEFRLDIKFYVQMVYVDVGFEVMIKISIVVVGIFVVGEKLFFVNVGIYFIF